MYSSTWYTLCAENPGFEIVQESVKVCTTGMSSRTLYAQHTVSLAYVFLSRGKSSTVQCTVFSYTPAEVDAPIMYSSINRLYAKNPVFEIVHEESVKVYHLHMYNGNLQQNSMRRILCHSGISHLSSVLACVFSSRCNVLHVICEHHALGAVLLSSMRLVRSAMGEYLVLALGTAGYRLGPLRKGTHGTFLIGQSAPFFIHPSPN